MGITDALKAGSSAKSKQVTIGGTNGGPETSIPQMVITSAEGESEELTLENDGEPIQRPSGQDAIASSSVVQEPAVTDLPEIPIKEDVPLSSVKPLEEVKSAVQRPLIINSEAARVESIAIVPESIYEVIEPKTSIPLQQNGLSDGEEADITQDHPKSSKEGDGFFAKSKTFWKYDSKSLFSFPKFSFGHKEPKDTKKAEKTKMQEYSLEDAQTAHDSSMSKDHYRKIDDNAVPEAGPSSAVPSADQGSVPKTKDVSFKPTERSSMIHPTTQGPKVLPDIHRAEEENFDLADERYAGNRPVGLGRRAGTPESLYDTCCIKLAVLLRNKAIEITSEGSKIFPPKKPPKPTAEALAKARSEVANKKLKEYQNRPHHFGDDIPVGVNGIRYADEDTESSNDYRDLENYGVVSNPECYGIIRKLKSENDDSFRASSTCSYYTADTATLKDENSSDNTLETVSLGSYDSIVCRPEKKDESLEEPSDGKAEVSSSLPGTLTKNSDQSSTLKKVPPPVPPKPTFFSKSFRSFTKSIFPSSKASSTEVARCVNSLSLSPRPVLRSTAVSEGIKKRPLTIAGVRTTEFEQFSRSDKLESPAKKPVLTTVVTNKSLKTVRNLPLEPKGLNKSLSFSARPKPSEVTSVGSPTSKPQPPPRPPPPTVVSSSKRPESPPASNKKEVSPAPKISTPVRKIIPRPNISPPRPSPPVSKPVVSPPPIKPVSPPPPKPKVSPPPPKPKVSPPPPKPKVSPPSVKPVVSPPPVKPVVSPPPIKPTVRPPRPPPPLPKFVSSPISGSISVLQRDSESDKHVIKSEISSPDITVNEDETFIDVPLNASPVAVDTGKHIPSHSEKKEEMHSVEKEVMVEPLDHVQEKYNVFQDDTIKAPARRSKPPRPPPRGRRNRSRTVEVVKVTETVVEVRRRSQSLSDIEAERRSIPSSPPTKEDIKAIYTTVNKDSSRAKMAIRSTDKDLDHLSSSTEAMSSRPLPAPPPPPRSKSHSASRRSKSDERPSTASSMCDDYSLSKCESMPSDINGNDVKPPARKKKSERELFFSLGRLNKKYNSSSQNFGSLTTVGEIKGPPVKPERRVKHSPLPQFDENANIANPMASKFYTEPRNFKASEVPPALPSRPRVKSLGGEKETSGGEKQNGSSSLLQRSKSESRKPHSLWYDDGTVDSLADDSWEKVDYPTESDLDQVPQNIKRPPRTKTARQTSTFYVEVKDNEDDPPYENTAVFPSHEDKETSPLPLECSEKSVQTSLETISVSRASRGDLSEDTDDLLDLAQTLQDELKTIIKRHKSGEALRSSDESSDPSTFDHHRNSKKIPTVTPKARPLLDSTTSSASELWQLSSSEESENECNNGEPANLSELSRNKKKKKIFYIAQEITSSEEAFVDSLKLLNVDFRAFVDGLNKQKGAAILPDEVLSQIFNHLPQLQHLNENLLMELKYRIEQWDSVNKIADVIVKMGPFLKLYSWYIQDFEATTSLLEEAKKKYVLFGQACKDYEMSPRCKRLSLNHYMLRPVQRIPQYRLLLQEYLHHLPEGSEDYEDTVEALKIVSEVANHANESMRHGDNFQKLISIQSSIIGHKEIIKPGRMFIKEGELMKLSRKGMQPRWFVLMNDLLLYLTPVQQGLYRINHELTLAGMKVAIPLQQDYKNEFSIISVTRSFTLNAKSPEERQDWIVALTKAIEENASKRSTFTAVRLQQRPEQASEEVHDQGFVLGKTAPVWIPDARVTMCQSCTSEFTVTFRRHHCRACGKVICSICSSNRISLQYLGNRIARVCDECYSKLGQGSSACTESGETDSDNQQIAVKSHLRTDHRYKKGKRQLPSVLKEVRANDVGSTISGYIHKRCNNSWKKSWFVIKEKVLYEFKASEDVAALKSLPLLGFQINVFAEPFEGIDASLLFEISHPGQAPVLFHAETTITAERWIKELKDATVLE